MGLLFGWNENTPHQKKVWKIGGGGLLLSVWFPWFGLPMFLYALYLEMVCDKDGNRN